MAKLPKRLAGETVDPPATLRSKFLAVLGFCAVLAAVGNVGLAFRDAWYVKARVDQLEQELSRAQEQNRQTRRQIDALQSDPRAVEQVRRFYHKTQPGEEVLTR